MDKSTPASMDTCEIDAPPFRQPTVFEFQFAAV